MNDICYDAVTTIAAERADIGITMSSTPTGKRSHFYKACTDPKMGFVEHFHPSMHNPNWCDKMEGEFRAQLTDQAYVHEIEAEFGTQDTGVFPKDKLDLSITYENYAYNDLLYDQIKKVERENIKYTMYKYSESNPCPRHPFGFRTMGVKNRIILLPYAVMYRKKYHLIAGSALELYVPNYIRNYIMAKDNALGKVKIIKIG